jgi:hypothetical protein
MSTWAIWKQAFDHINLKMDGDPSEKRGAIDHGLDISFANYEVFWRYHVVPATNRPANIDLRRELAPQFSRVIALSYSLFIDLLNSADSLVQIKAGDLGDACFRKCTDAIKSDGDAVQKFTDLQKAIESGVSIALQKPIHIWSKSDWDNVWFPSREKIIGYRNFLTHMGRPQTMIAVRADGSYVPYVLHQDYIVRGQFLTWQEQEAIYRSNPEKWEKLTTVCEELHSESIKWLNDAYAEIIRSMDPFLADENYQNLWGWDTAKHGRHVWKQSDVMGTQGLTPANRPHLGSGAGVGRGYVPGGDERHS